MVALPSTTDRLQSLLEALTLCQRGTLDRRGTCVEANGRLDVQDVTLSVACDTGGKSGNQDFALMSQPSQSPCQPPRLRWAAAVADGVSSSVLSQDGSRFACHLGLSVLGSLYACNKQTKSPIAAVQKMFRGLAGIVESDAERFRPDRVTKSSWERVVRDGRFLQSTLMLAWQDEEGLNIQGVGDGGFVLRHEPESAPLSLLPFSDKPVHCLGPKNAIAGADYSFRFANWDTLTLFTDGLTPAFHRRGDEIDQQLHQVSQHQDLNPASETVANILSKDADLIDDNVTLFTARRAGL